MARGRASRSARRAAGASRAFVAAMVVGVALTWSLGDPRIVWREIGAFVPGNDAGARGVHDGYAGPGEVGGVDGIDGIDGIDGLDGIDGIGGLDGFGDRAEVAPRLLDTRGGPVVQRLEVPMPMGPDARGVHVETYATIEALHAPAASLHRQPALVQLVFRSGRHSLGTTQVAALPAAASRVMRGTRAAVPPGTDRIELALAARAGTGTHRIALTPVRFSRRRDGYLLAACLLATGWAVLAALMARASARAGAGRTLRCGAAGALAFVVVGTGASAALPAGGLLGTLQGGVSAVTGGDVRAAGLLWESGHVATFALAALCLGVLRRALGTGRTALVTGLVALALATEALQRHLPDRTASLADLGADVAGIALGLCCVAVWHRTRRGRRYRERASLDRRAAERRGAARPGSGDRRRRTRRRSATGRSGVASRSLRDVPRGASM